MISRRIFARGLGALGLASVAHPNRAVAQGMEFAKSPPLIPILARPDRIFQVTVCLRPFRAAGPRIDIETVGDKKVVHHYGHGGSGWSLSWGSAQEAVPLALGLGETEIAVIGAGAIGLTTAITAQRMGVKVVIYAKERFPVVRSARATGGWTPNSRIAMADETAADFGDRWERMARASFTTHQSYLGLAGHPVEWTDRYILSDKAPNPQPAAESDVLPASPEASQPPARHFVELDERLRDLKPRPVLLAPGTYPFPAPFVQRTSSLTYNIADLCRQLESDFQIAGGRFVVTEFRAPADLARIREKVVINCTGYGARALFQDQSIVPVRGQIAWLIPQEGVDYGIQYKDKELNLLARRDGIVVQPMGKDDFFGFDDADETPDYAAARAGVELAATLFRGAPESPN